jgi:hypothetical protein
MAGGLNRLFPIGCLFLLSVLAGAAFGQPPAGADPNSPLGLWYRSLTAPYSGGSCCSVADCRPVEARLVGEGWEIRVRGIWIEVPPSVVLKRDNPDGRPIACIFAGDILCFVPPPAT